MDVALFTCRELPEPDFDAAPLTAALDRAGLTSSTLAWDDPAADWTGARMTLLRSCWNYHLDRPAFLRWAKRVAEISALWNPLAAIRWSSHKGYLLELDRLKVPVAPTVLIPKGSSRTLPGILEEQDWTDVVVKPAVSAASWRTLRADRARPEDGERHLRALLADGDALVQRYLPSVEDHGERALVWIDGALTHAVRKSPRFAGEDESVSDAVEISPDESDLAGRAVEAARVAIAGGSSPAAPLLYARIDVAPGPGGGPVVMELELIEPSLFFPQCPEALERFARAIRDRLEESP